MTMNTVTIPPHLALITVGHIAASMDLISEQIERVVDAGDGALSPDGLELADLLEAHEQAERLSNLLVHQIGGSASSIWSCVDDDCRWLNPGELELCESCGTHMNGSL